MSLRVGVAEVDITPPVGTPLAGSLFPRDSVGVQDPLYAKAIVIESGGKKIAYVVLDLIALNRANGDRAVALASRRAGIPAYRIVWAASHTHTGPYSVALLGGIIEEGYLERVELAFADAVAAAAENLRPARMCRARGYCNNLCHNRRLRFKDGREINTWLLNGGEEDTQCLGSAGPVDPELGIVAFENEAKTIFAVIWHYTLHTNTNFSKYFSADYPGVVAARLQQRYGRDCLSFFMPGTCGNINTVVRGYDKVGNIIADELIGKLDHRRVYCEEAPAIGSVKAEYELTVREPQKDYEEMLQNSQWNDRSKEVFRKEIEIIREQGMVTSKTVLQAWHVGEVGFASLPGEAFVEYGLELKERSPFPWTFPVELGGDYVGYMITRQAWEAGGYESLLCRSSLPDVESNEGMTRAALGLLGGLHAAHRKQAGL
jgi:hypothetical protein